jgi:peptide/nickel transport system permease protein
MTTPLRALTEEPIEGPEISGTAAAGTAWTDATIVVPPRRTPVLFRFMRNRGAAIGLVVFLFIVLTAVIGPHIWPFDAYRSVPKDQLAPPGTAAHLLGADHLGRDVAGRMLHGALLSLQIGFIAVFFAVVLGVLFGLPAGYFGGSTDMLVSRVVDILLSFPSILLALSIVSVLGANLTNAMIAVGISVVPVYIRLVRASTLTTRHLLYVEAARVIGLGHVAIMARHILPNIMAPLIVVATLGVATAIIVGASLSFLGLGAQPPTPEWGAMLSEGRGFIQTAWWMSVFPGLAIMITVLAINLIGDGLRDLLDPRLGRT